MNPVVVVVWHIGIPIQVFGGVRSRVVNAKRTVLSKGVRKKIEVDNCGLLLGSGGTKKLKGWNDVEFNATNDTTRGSGSVATKRLVRGFFGHTRFATSSKASLDGTHPHRWTPRHMVTCYGFQSKEGALQGEEELESSEHPLGFSSHHSYGRREVVGKSFRRASCDRGHVMRVGPKGRLMGVENFVTHNGECVCVIASGEVGGSV